LRERLHSRPPNHAPDLPDIPEPVHKILAGIGVSGKVRRKWEKGGREQPAAGADSSNHSQREMSGVPREQNDSVDQSQKWSG